MIMLPAGWPQIKVSFIINASRTVVAKLPMPLVNCHDNCLSFDSTASKKQAFDNGFFAVKIPDELKISPLILLLNEF